jgi:hypothetical protein
MEKLTLEALKALAYDNLVQSEQAQNNLKILNAEIAKRNSEEALKRQSAVKEKSK